jgi:hypothetical protein
MNASHGAPMALGFILAIPLFVLPALGAPAHETGHKPSHHRAADLAKARALVSPSSDLVPEAVLPLGAEYHGQQRPLPETDGLGRADEECNFGCIDH